VLSSLWSPYRRAALLNAAVVAFVGGTVAVERVTINRLLHDDAVSAATRWTQLLAENTADLEKISAGTPPSDETRAFLARVKTVARVFLYKVYDAQGVPRFVSDDLEEQATDEAGLIVHNPEAAEAIEMGAPAIEVKEGTPPGRPAFYSEAAFRPSTRMARSRPSSKPT
jgi:hypothetical protein